MGAARPLGELDDRQELSRRQRDRQSRRAGQAEPHHAQRIPAAASSPVKKETNRDHPPDHDHDRGHPGRPAQRAELDCSGSLSLGSQQPSASVDQRTRG